MTVTSTNKETKAIHPGVYLKEKYMLPMELSSRKLADRLGLAQTRVLDLSRGVSAVNMNIALRLAKAFETTPEFWLDLQLKYDLATERSRPLDPEIEAIRSLLVPLPKEVSKIEFFGEEELKAVMLDILDSKFIPKGYSFSSIDNKLKSQKLLFSSLLELCFLHKSKCKITMCEGVLESIHIKAKEKSLSLENSLEISLSVSKTHLGTFINQEIVKRNIEKFKQQNNIVG